MNRDFSASMLIKGVLFVVLGLFFFLDQADILALHLGLLASAVFVVLGIVMVLVSRRKPAQQDSLY
ncbi:MAG: hypothetical protein ACC652_07010 [Acidimicrobiales bacterium]